MEHKLKWKENESENKNENEKKCSVFWKPSLLGTVACQRERDRDRDRDRYDVEDIQEWEKCMTLGM